MLGRSVTARIAILAALGAALLAPAAADARLLVVATGDERPALLDAATHQVVTRLTAAAPAQDVVVARDGTRAWVAAGAQVLLVDLRAPANVTSRTLPAPVAGLALSPGDGLLYAAGGGQLSVLDSATLATVGHVRLRGRPRGVAVSPTGGRALVALANNRVALLDIGARRVLRRFHVRAPGGVAFDGPRRALASSGRGRLFVVDVPTAG